MACCWSSIRVTSSTNQAPSTRSGRLRCCPVADPLLVHRQPGDARRPLGDRAALVGHPVVGLGDAPQAGQRLADDAVATAAWRERAAHGDVPHGPACWLIHRTWAPNSAAWRSAWASSASVSGSIRITLREGHRLGQPVRRPSGREAAASSPRPRRVVSRGSRRCGRRRRRTRRRGTAGGAGPAPSTPRRCSTSSGCRPSGLDRSTRRTAASTAPDGSVCATRKRAEPAEQLVVVRLTRGQPPLDQPGGEQRRRPDRRVRPSSASAVQPSCSTRCSRTHATPRSALSSAPGCPAAAAWYRPITAPAWRTRLYAEAGLAIVVGVVLVQPGAVGVLVAGEPVDGGGGRRSRPAAVTSGSARAGRAHRTPARRRAASTAPARTTRPADSSTDQPALGTRGVAMPARRRRSLRGDRPAGDREQQRRQGEPRRHRQPAEHEPHRRASPSTTRCRRGRRRRSGRAGWRRRRCGTGRASRGRRVAANQRAMATRDRRAGRDHGSTGRPRSRARRSPGTRTPRRSAESWIATWKQTAIQTAA